MGVRIVAGRFGGRILKSPRGTRLRPSAGRLREALFSILGPGLTGATFLDLFAGTGGIGYEALSRGALRVVFVENDPAAVEAIRRSAADLEVHEEIEILPKDVFDALESLEERGESFTVIFADPPYKHRGHERLLRELEGSTLLPADGLLVLERHQAREVEVPDGLERVRSEVYGDAALDFIERRPPSAARP